jgi:hypothetical protein
MLSVGLRGLPSTMIARATSSWASEVPTQTLPSGSSASHSERAFGLAALVLPPN